jgi:hypothetical protein
MRQLLTKRFFTPENLFVAGVLFFYAVILLSSDPEWLMWAGPITLGAFPVTSPPSPLPFDPAEAFRAAATGVFLGLLALAVLLLASGDTPAVSASLDKTPHTAFPSKP